MDIPSTDSVIGNKLKEFQNPNGIQFFDEWFKDIVKKADTSDKIDAIIKQIEDFVATIDKADRKQMKIIKKKKRDGTPEEKDLSRLAAYAETLKKSTLKAIQKALEKANAAATKRLEDEARKSSLKNTIGELKEQLKDILQFLPSDINLSRYQRASLASLENIKEALQELYQKRKTYRDKIIADRIKAEREQREIDKLEHTQLISELQQMGVAHSTLISMTTDDLRRLKEKKTKDAEDLSKRRASAMENYRNSTLPVNVPLFENDDGEIILKQSGTGKDKYDIIQCGRYGQVEVLGIQKSNNDINSVIIHKVNSNEVPGDEKKNRNFANKYMIENNRFVGSSEEEGHLIHDIPIPEENVLMFDQLSSESMDNVDSIRLNGSLIPEYTKTKWLTNVTKGKVKELVPDDIQLKSLVSNPDDILIAHKPGEGKTANAILLAEMKRNIALSRGETPPRILIIAPGAPILIQWQQQVIKWGFDPSHWVFQTYAHFYLSQSTTNYPSWENLDDDTKNVYKEIWRNPKEPQFLSSAEWNTFQNTIVVGSANYFNPPLSEDITRDGVRKKLKKSVLDVVHRIWLLNINGDKYWNDVPFSEISEDENDVYRCIIDYFFKNNTPNWKRIQKYRDNLLFNKQDDGIYITCDLIKNKNEEFPFRNRRFNYTMRDRRRSNQNNQKLLESLNAESYQFNECKSLLDIEQKINKLYSLRDDAPVMPNITTVDKFINTSHGSNLVQHRYACEKEVIFIVDECHKALSPKGDDKPMTENIFYFGLHPRRANYANILVSATPWLSSEYKKLMRVTANFLKRSDEFVIPDNNIDMDLLYKDLYGKITRALYSMDIETIKEKLIKNKYLDLRSHGRKGREFLKKYLFGNEMNFDDFRSVEQTGLKKEQKDALVHAAFDSLYIERSNKWENPFPAKIPLSNGFQRVDMDLMSCYLMCHSDDATDVINPDFAYKIQNPSDAHLDNIVFHEEASNALRDHYKEKHPYFFPLVVTIEDEESGNDILSSRGAQSLAYLQRMAYCVRDRWIVVLHIYENDTESIHEALRKINMADYDSNNPLALPPNFRERGVAQFNLPESIESYLNDYDGDCPVHWCQTDTSNGPANIPNLLSSKVEQIVIMIEDAAKANKNVLVYHKNIEIILAIERGLLIRKNKRVDLWKDNGDPSDELLQRMMSSKQQKWLKWEQEYREGDLDAVVNDLCASNDNDHPYIKTLKDRVKNHVEEQIDQGTAYGDDTSGKYTHVVYNSNEMKPVYVRRLKTPSYTSNSEGMWELDDGLLVRDQRKPKGFSPIKKKDYIIWRLKTWKYLNPHDEEGLSMYFRPIQTEIVSYLPPGDRISLKRIMTAYVILFDAMGELYGEHMNSLSKIATYMQVNFSKKFLKTASKQQEVIQSAEKLGQLLRDDNIRKYFVGVDSVDTGIILPFIELVRSAFKDQMNTANISSDSTTGYWTRNVREKVYEYTRGIFRYFEQIGDYDPEVLAMHRDNLKSGYFTMFELPKYPTNEMYREIKEIASDIDLDVRNDLEGLILSFQDFHGYVKYLYTVSANKKKEDLLYQLGYSNFTDVDKNLHLSPKETEYVKYLVNEKRKSVNRELMQYNDLEQRIIDRKNKIRPRLLYVDNTRMFEVNQNDANHRKMYKFLHGSLKSTDIRFDTKIEDTMVGDEPLDALTRTSHLIEKSALAKMIEEDTVVNDLDKKDKIKLYKLSHDMEKLKSSRDKLSALKKELKEKKKLQMLLTKLAKTKKAADVSGIGYLPERPSEESMIVAIEEADESDKNSDQYKRLLKKWNRFKQMKTPNPLTIGENGMTVEKFYDILLEIIQLLDIIELKWALQINNWKWLHIETFVNEWNFSQDEYGIIKRANKIKLKDSSPDATPGQRPYVSNSPLMQDDIRGGELGADDQYTREFSYLRQSVKNATFAALKKRVSGMLEDNVTFSILTGKHTPDNDQRKMNKLAFECGLLDCLLMNASVREGIDYTSSSESICIMVEPERNPDIEDQFVGRLVRKESHNVCPKEFRKVSYVAFESKYPDKPFEVREFPRYEELQPLDTPFERAEEDLSEGIEDAFMMHYESDSDDEYTSSAIKRAGSRAKNQKKIEAMVKAKYPDATDQQVRDAIKKVQKEHRKEILSNEQILDLITSISVRKKRQAYGNIEVDAEKTIQDWVERLAFRAVRFSSTYFNVSSVVKYKNHAFINPYELLESDLKYEFDYRKYDKKKKVDTAETYEFGWCCNLCNYENPSQTTCVKCNAPIGDYIKLEPFYIDEDIIITRDHVSEDSYKRAIYEKISTDLDIINADLAPISIEHTAKSHSDLTMKISHEHGDGETIYLQRVKVSPSKVQKPLRTAKSRFLLVHPHLDKVEAKQEVDESPILEDYEDDDTDDDLDEEPNNDGQKRIIDEDDEDDVEDAPENGQKRRPIIDEDDDDDDSEEEEAFQVEEEYGSESDEEVGVMLPSNI
jgi:hypothetical protein